MLPAVGLAIALYVVAVFLLVHHGYKHSKDDQDSPARAEGIPCLCYFQIKDVSNHETWILVCLTNAITLTVVAAV